LNQNRRWKRWRSSKPLRESADQIRSGARWITPIGKVNT